MTKMKKKYQRPALELFPVESFCLLEGSKKSGYAIDNDDANDDNIIPIEEDWTNPGGTGENDDDFIEID